MQPVGMVSPISLDAEIVVTGGNDGPWILSRKSAPEQLEKPAADARTPMRRSRPDADESSPVMAVGSYTGDQ